MFSGRRLKPDEVDQSKVVYSPDKKYAMTYYMEGHREDRYEEVTDWVVMVWETQTKKVVQQAFFRYDHDYQFNETSGVNVYKVAFSEDMKFLLINGAKSDKTKIPFKPKE